MLQKDFSRIKKRQAVASPMLGAIPANPAWPDAGDKLYNLPVLHSETLKIIQQNFLTELEQSMAGHKTSLPFILHSLASKPLTAENEIFQVMVIGGSVFKEGVAKKGKTLKFLSQKQEKMPVFHTKKEFIELVEKNLNPEAGVVALNFAYPLGPVFDDGKLDGVLLSGTKEHKFTGLVGERVGQTLEQHFLKKHNRKVKFTIANDTVCLLLSGLDQAGWEKLACGIVGTGVNFAFFIGPTDLVNLESANFNNFPISYDTKQIDINSSHVGRALFEKETAGGYLYQHFNSMIKRQKLPHPPIESTLELKKLALRDTSWISPIAKGLIKKSAALVATQIGGITLFKKHDMTFVMEGSFFWGENIYKEYVENYLKILIPDYKVKFVSVDDSPFVGAAKLVA